VSAGTMKVRVTETVVYEYDVKAEQEHEAIEVALDTHLGLFARLGAFVAVEERSAEVA
jgi:hypothetical protein